MHSACIILQPSLVERKERLPASSCCQQRSFCDARGMQRRGSDRSASEACGADHHHLVTLYFIT
jgi:hypothetical protein